MNKLEIPNLDRWRAGELPDEVMFNELQDAQDFLLDPPAAKVYKNTTQSVTTGGAVKEVVWNAVEYDKCKPFGPGYTTAMWDPGDPNKLTARVGGWYDLYFTVSWDTTTDDARRLQMFAVNGDIDGLHWGFGRHDVWHVNNWNLINTVMPVFLNKGDFLKIYVWHNKGSSININPAVEGAYGRRTQAKLKWVSL